MEHRPADLSEALTSLKNAVTVSLPLAPDTIDGIMGSARAVYAGACTPENTKLITRAIDHVLSDPTYREDPEIRAFYANVRCCDYLNHWNGAATEDLEAAERSVAIALRSNPKHRRAVYVSAFLHRARGRRKQAQDAFNQFIALNPQANDRMLAEAYAQTGSEWMHLGHPERTQELVDRAIAITPEDSPALGVFFGSPDDGPLCSGNIRKPLNFWRTRSASARTFGIRGHT